LQQILGHVPITYLITQKIEELLTGRLVQFAPGLLVATGGSTGQTEIMPMI